MDKKKRLSKVFFYYVWILVILRFIVPVSLPIHTMTALQRYVFPNGVVAGIHYDDYDVLSNVPQE